MTLFQDGYVWGDPAGYADAIMERSDKRGWRLDERSVRLALAGIRPHTDVLRPSAFRLFLGKGAYHDWTEATTWLANVISGVDRAFVDVCHVSSTVPWHHYAVESGPSSPSEAYVEATYLDFQTHDLSGGVDGERETLLALINSEPTWPGLDLIWLFALNPEMYIRGWKRIPSLIMPGIVLTNEASDQDARDSAASTSCGFVPRLYQGWGVDYVHRGSAVDSSMCLVSYAS